MYREHINQSIVWNLRSREVILNDIHCDRKKCVSAVCFIDDSTKPSLMPMRSNLYAFSD